MPSAKASAGLSTGERVCSVWKGGAIGRGYLQCARLRGSGRSCPQPGAARPVSCLGRGLGERAAPCCRRWRRGARGSGLGQDQQGPGTTWVSVSKAGADALIQRASMAGRARYSCAKRVLPRRTRRAVMASKANFTPDEWTKLLESPMMAGLAITAAEPSAYGAC
jgi:hypothetical protein